MLLQRTELVTFDPSKKAHREAAAAFMKRKAWSDSPLRFAHSPAYGSVADQVQAQMLEWYVAREMNTKTNSWKDERLVGCKCPSARKVSPRCHIHSASYKG